MSKLQTRIIIILSVALIIALIVIGFLIFKLGIFDNPSKYSNERIFNEFLDCYKQCPAEQSEDINQDLIVNQLCAEKCQYDWVKKYGQEKLEKVQEEIEENPYENYEISQKLSCLEDCDSLYSCEQACLK